MSHYNTMTGRCGSFSYPTPCVAGPPQKQTSLHDFKKLLSQQSPGQNPHRISARELLEKTAPVQSSHSRLGTGSARKRSSPWVDKRFSVIQEEMEGSKENLIE